MLNSSSNTQKSDCTRNMVCHYCAIKKLNGTVQRKWRFCWKEVFGHTKLDIFQTLYMIESWNLEHKSKTSLRTWQQFKVVFKSWKAAILHFLTSEIYIFQHILVISQPFFSILVSKCLVWSHLLNYATFKLNGSNFDSQLPQNYLHFRNFFSFGKPICNKILLLLIKGRFQQNWYQNVCLKACF